MAPDETVGQSPHGPIEFVRLTQVDTAGLLRILNDARVVRHMPLAGGEMTEADVQEWVRVKERHWDKLGFGPWGIRIAGTLAGWGGLQPFNGGDVEIALVLMPEFWGWGKTIFAQITEFAFGELGLSHVLVALPPSRARARGLIRLGFTRVDTTEIEGQPFVVYRLDAVALRRTL